MPPKKRRSTDGKIEHRGRVTAPRDPTAVPYAATPAIAKQVKRQGSGSLNPAPSSRYTPPKKSVRFRPGWHKGVGAAVLLVGIAVAVLNDVMLLDPSKTLLPGGHSEFYLMLGIIIAGYSTWWFAWFDREK